MSIKIIKEGGPAPLVIMKCRECGCEFEKEKGLCKQIIKPTKVSKGYEFYTRCPNCHCVAYGNIKGGHDDEGA